MPSLPELQRAFGAALLSGETVGIAPLIVPNRLDPAARLRIYRNNVHENFLAALRASFPVLERLVGAGYFRQLAFGYMQRFPSPSGNLHHTGERLPAYLERRFASTEYGYLADVARLEWAFQEVQVAEEHPPFELARLAAVDPEVYTALRFVLHPAVRLVTSIYPILQIWRANQPDQDGKQVIDLRQGGERVLLQRTAEAIELSALPAGECALLNAFHDGETVGRAAQLAAQSASDEFDLGHTLRRFVNAGVIVDFLTGPAN